jgi:predicted ATPase
MTKTYIQRVELEGIHRRYDLRISFHETLNVLHGKNGTGKSTLIHIIANVANGDFLRFAFLDFSTIIVHFSDDRWVKLTQNERGEHKVVRVSTESGATLEFDKKEAYEAVRSLEDDRRFGEFAPELVQRIKDFVDKNNLKFIATAYFPAFRTMLEAWSSQRDPDRPYGRRTVNTRKATTFSRNLFGQFLPTINFPSPIDIEERLRTEIRDAQLQIARYESSIFSKSFVKVFSALLNGSKAEKDSASLLKEISNLNESSSKRKLGVIEDNSETYQELQHLVSSSFQSNELASSAAGALEVYRDALQQRKDMQEDAFAEIDKYFDVVNSFLDNKKLSYQLDTERRIPKVGLMFPDHSWSSIKVMSSGERQLLTMLYAVTRMSGNTAVLIDEPELSLHIDWQEDLLRKMMEQLGDRQIIVCTHSPAIAADFGEFMKEIEPAFQDIQGDHYESTEDDEGYA